jgi:hypothetical protein
MAANPVVINESGNTGSDYEVETREVTGGGQVQQVQIDIGTGTSTSPVTSANPLPVTDSKNALGTAAAVTNVSGSATSVTIKASNTSRKELIVFNDSTAILYLLYGSGSASTTNYTLKVFPDTHAIIDSYNGQVNGIWASATGDARVTEVTF